MATFLAVRPKAGFLAGLGMTTFTGSKIPTSRKSGETWDTPNFQLCGLKDRGRRTAEGGCLYMV